MIWQLSISGVLICPFIIIRFSEVSIIGLCVNIISRAAVFIYYLGYKSKNIFQNIKTEVEKTVNDFIQFCIVINIE